MTKIFSFLFLAVLSFQTGLSQTGESAPYITDSSRSIQFGIGMLTLRSFGDQTMSYRWHQTPGTAIRIGVSVSASGRTDETVTSAYRGDTLVGQSRSTSTDLPRIDFTLSAQYQWYVRIQDDLYLFAGAGPQFGYNQRDYPYDEYRMWTAGLNGGFGAEWFASRRLSLHGEYQIHLLYRHTISSEWEDFSSGDSKFYDRTGDSFDITSGAVLFGLSVYF
jgi:hypothetical protein